jgi:hypothetical protein
MTNPKSRIFAAVAGVLSLGAAAAWAVEPTQQIQDLQARVAELEARQAQNSRDLAATIDGVLRDAEQRSQLLAAGADMGAGYDNGFYIRGTGWQLNPWAQFQFRNVTDFRQNTGGHKDDEIENGFEVRRMKFGLDGYAFSKDVVYSFVWAADVEGGGVALEDAWVKYMFADDWAVRAGQFKDPVHHEELTSSKRQLAADRSLLNELLGGGILDRTQGITLVYGDYNANNPVNVEFGLTDGFNEENTNYTKHSFDFGVAGRAEFRAMGDWKSYKDFTAMGTKENLLVIGLGGDYSQAGDGDIWTGTIDAQFEASNGLGLYGAALVRNIDEELLGSTDDMTDWGLLIQAGYMLNKSWELFGRYDVTIFDQELAFADNEDTFHEFTVGLNYYLGTDGSAGHRAKITLDLSYLPNGSPSGETGIGYIGDTSGDDEWSLRAQLQLLI